jgi:nicotinate-nucleotide pyrophosphorylase (carboxylating)
MTRDVQPASALLDDSEITKTVHAALDEDVGSGDLTAALLLDEPTTARVISREEAVICGRPWFDKVFHLLDQSIQIDWLIQEGERAGPGQTLCQLNGSSRALVTGERTALNFLQTLSGVATTVRLHVNEVRGTRTRILDTRKTLPGLRKAQKYAVRCGGGYNHRIGLYDGILIKENHIHAAGSLCSALEQARKNADPECMIEVEVENLEQLHEAIECRASRVLLDNFPLEMLPVAVTQAGDVVETEVSGNVILENLAQIAATGVDYISVGALTKNIRAIDLSMRFIN